MIDELVQSKKATRPGELARVPVTNLPTIAPRPDQARLAADLVEILGRADHAYLEAPTGTGKTLTIALTGNSFPEHNKILLANTVDLVRQARADLERFSREGLIDFGSWTFMTWQAFVSHIKRETLNSVLDTTRPEIVFVDECHIGGTGQGREKKSFPIIRDAVSRVVWVSATPWDIDEATMGPRRDHTALFSASAAYQDGLLHDVDLVRIDCGLQLKVAIANLEQRHNTRFHMLASRDFEIEGEQAEELLDLLEEHGPERGLSLRDVRAIIVHRIRLMAAHYLEHHSGEKAIFWVPNQHYAKECATYISERLAGADRAEPIVTDASGGVAQAEHTNAALRSFRDPNGAVKVACVVYRLREGFDMPALHLGYDCAWNPYNLRASTQKIGRLTRKSPGKPGSAYHYAVDVKTVLAANSDYNQDYLDQLACSLSLDPQAARSTADAVYENLGLRQAWSTDPISPAAIACRSQAFGSRQYPVTQTPLFEFLSARGSKEIERHTFASMMTERQSRSAHLHLMLDELAGGSDWNDYPRNVQVNFLNAANPTQVLYLPEIRERLAKIRPDLLPVTQESRRRHRIERFHRVIDNLQQGADFALLPAGLRNEFIAAVNPRCREFIPELHDRLALVRRDLIPRTKAEVREARISNLEALVERLAAGEPLSALTKPQRTLISNAANPKVISQFLPQFRERLAAICPAAIPVPRSRAAQSHSHWSSSILEVID